MKARGPVALLLFVLALTACGSARASLSAGVAACSSGQLVGVAKSETAAMGNVNMPLVFRNRSNAACYVEGFPSLTVLDARGRVIIRTADVATQGTYFNDGAVTRVLLPPTTGQATVNFTWYDCRRTLASKLAVGLPDGNGTLMMPFAQRAAASPACQRAGVAYSTANRGPFSP